MQGLLHGPPRQGALQPVQDLASAQEKTGLLDAAPEPLPPPHGLEWHGLHSADATSQPHAGARPVIKFVHGKN